MPKRILIFLLTSVLAFSCKRMPQLQVLQVKELEDFPSGSAIVYHEDKVWIAGDDAKSLLAVDMQMNPSDSILVYPSPLYRIPYQTKADLEAGTLLGNKRDSSILWLGSGSGTYRNTGVMIKLPGYEKSELQLDTFYDRLRNAGITKLNIEGLTQIPGWMVLGTRGHKSFPKNYLIFAENKFWLNQANSRFHLVRMGGNLPPFSFRGLSGLDYSYRSDILLATASTEDTRSAEANGKIGKSFLWRINDLNKKVQYSGINPNVIYDLAETDARFSGAKIESVTVIKDAKNYLECWLAAENDDGKTTLFRIRMFR